MLAGTRNRVRFRMGKDLGYRYRILGCVRRSNTSQLGNDDDCQDRLCG